MLLGLDAQAPHSSLVAAVLRQRLSPAGQAVICCAVRDQASLRAHSRHCLLCLSTILYFVLLAYSATADSVSTSVVGYV